MVRKDENNIVDRQYFYKFLLSYFLAKERLKEREKMFNKKGFTLLELIIVIIVIGILASIAMPRYMRVAERARVTEAKICSLHYAIHK